MKHLTVIGCGGFIGSHLLDRLLSRDDISIEGWDPEVSKIRGYLQHPRFTLHKQTMNEPSAQAELTACIARSDAVLNLAAICNPSEYNTRPLQVIRSNLFDVYRLVETCAEQKKWLIHFSTSEVYGRTLASYVGDGQYDDARHYELKEDQTPLIMGSIHNQRWTYACAKQLTERIVYAHHAESGMPFTMIRPLNFFGPRMDYIPGRDGDGLPRVLACFMTALFDRTPLKLVDGGLARRTIVSIYEAVDAIERMLDRPEAAQNQIFNIGNRHNEVTMAELADRMRRIYAEITGDASYASHPMEAVDSATFYGRGYEDCDRRMPDVSKARQLLDWEARMPLDEVLRDTMSYYHDHYVRGELAAQ